MPPRIPGHLALIVLAFAVAQATACSGDVTSPSLSANLLLTTATTGADRDPDGYLLRVDDGAALPIGSDTRLVLSGISPGSHVVALEGIAANCTLVGPASRPVALVAGDTGRVDFAVTCRAPATVAGQILYWDGKDGQLYRTDGATTVALTPGSDGRAGRWSPDRSRIAFASTRNGKVMVFVMDADGSETASLTEGRNPSWSPDGHRLVIATDQGLATINVDGTDARPVTDDATDDWPAWSPDGTRIAYAHQSHSLCQASPFFKVICAVDLRTVAPDGTGVVAVTSAVTLTTSTQPVWSPDGTRIAFTYSEGWTLGGSLRIYAVRPDGSERVGLTYGSDRQQFPAWSPDGTELVVADAPPGASFRLATIPAAGGFPTPVGTAAGPVFPSSWR